MNLKIPELSLVVLIGPSGSGKSTFAKKYFRPTEVLSSDFCRGLVSDNENDQTATKAAFEVLHFIAAKRLEAGKLTVIDATNVQPSARKPLIQLARQYHCLPVAIVLDMSERLCQDRNEKREDRSFSKHVIKQHKQYLRKSIRGLKKEGFRYIYTFTNEEDVSNLEIERQPLWNNLRHIKGPFDIIGDIHGCAGELEMLLTKMGYIIEEKEFDYEGFGYNIAHPEGRKAVFLGDLTDRGPDSLKVLKIVMSMVNSESAFCVPGNHDIKLLKKLNGKNVELKHGLDRTIEQLEGQPDKFLGHVKEFINSLISHYIFDDGNLVVAHGGMKESLQGRGSGKVREFALFGETTGETDEFGLPVRYNWADEYRGSAIVVYGHTPVTEIEWINNTIDIDTGCVFGGKLTALRYPEKELVSVEALYKYYEPVKPFESVTEKAYEQPDRDNDMLDITDVSGKKILSTRLRRNITIPEQNSAAAIEVMSRFVADPHWLIYLPPTMSPCETSGIQEYLEHPEEAFSYYRQRGIDRVVCEEKHMGSRAVVIACRDEEAASKTFKAADGQKGICYTRTGREFFSEEDLKNAFIDEVVDTLTQSEFWEKFETDWVCLDCELMPWSAKAQLLLKEQYSAVGTAGVQSLRQVVPLLNEAAGRELICFEVSNETSGKNMDIKELAARYQEKMEMLNKYVEAYRKYCWPVNSLHGYKLAPFHIMAVEGRTFINKEHLWHMNEINEICKAGSNLLMATNFMEVDVTNDDSIKGGVDWWYGLTQNGGEGMVVKPLDFTVKNENGLIQPAVKCRGREYLRIIYGPEYMLDKNMKKLKKRSLGKKRSLALREYALGVEALERFTRNEPLYRVHECVFGVLALESEPVDPRL